MKVRLYVEGGPKSCHADGLRRFKNAFKLHLSKLHPLLNALDVSPCGSTDDTIRDYARAVREQAKEWAVALLVDSDTPVTADTPAKHLQSKLDSAKIPRNARANIFLMVQCMEAWLVSDPPTLEKCFGKSMKASALPLNPDIEAVAKKDIIDALKSAIKPTSKGPYRKVQHGAEILAALDPKQVGLRSRHARSLHTFLLSSVQS